MKPYDEWGSADIEAFIACLRRLDGVSDDNRTIRANPPARFYLMRRRLDDMDRILAGTTVALGVCMIAVIVLLAIIA